MPTLRDMIVAFNGKRYREQKEQALLVGEEEYSLCWVKHQQRRLQEMMTLK